jgi:hypothetical protein
MTGTVITYGRNLTNYELIDAVREVWKRWASVRRSERPGHQRVAELVAKELNIGRLTAERLKHIGDALHRAEDSGDAVMLAQLQHRLPSDSPEAIYTWLRHQRSR